MKMKTQAPHVPGLHVLLVVLQDGHAMPFLHVAINFGPDIISQHPIYVCQCGSMAVPYCHTYDIRAKWQTQKSVNQLCVCQTMADTFDLLISVFAIWYLFHRTNE